MDRDKSSSRSAAVGRALAVLAWCGLALSAFLYAGCGEGDIGDEVGQEGAEAAGAFGLSAQAVSPTEVDLAWSSGVKKPKKSIVLRGPSSDALSTIATLPGSAKSYADTTVEPAQSYAYRVDVIGRTGQRISSSVASVTTPSDETPPGNCGDGTCGAGESCSSCPADCDCDTPSFLTSDRQIDWDRAGVPGGIPKRTTVCATLGTAGGNRSTVQSVTRSQINAAISSCPDNQVVLLNPGTYNLSGDSSNGDGILITRNNVTLRGSGPDKTLIKFPSGPADERIRIGQSPWDPPSPVTVLDWTGGYAKGTTQITLSGPLPSAQVGGVICLDQLYDGVNVRLTGASGKDSPSWLSRNGDRLLQQCVIATAVNGNTVTISPGLSSPYWSSAQSPQVWWMAKTSQVHMSGIEDLAIDPTGSNGEDTVHFNNTYACWMKNVETINTPRRALVVRHSLATEIRDSYIHGHQSDCTDGGVVEIGRRAVSDVLLENNIFYDVASAIYNEAATGNVVAYNYGTKFPYCVSGWLAETLNTHGAHPNMILIEGNQISQFVADDVYDPTSHITIFRNRFTGYDEGKTGGTVAISLVRWSDWFAAVGNVLGTAGIQDEYNQPLSGSGGGGGIFAFLYFTEYPKGLLRGGNYDTVTGGVIWSDNAPSGDTSTYLSSQALPASLYYGHGSRPTKPAWWNSSQLPNPNLPWPAIGPDVTGGDAALGGHAHDIPAKQCFDKLNLAGGGLYNGALCYGPG